MTPRITKVKRITYLDASETSNLISDITVDENHNLFVSDKVMNSPVLVHNCLDENKKFLSDLVGDYYYSLGNVSPQYGFNGYFEAEFSKADRANISKVDLDEKVLRYMSYDVCVPLAIHRAQKRRAAAAGHELYETLVRKQFSDQLHVFSRMETNGSKLDVSYLFYLRTPNSPIEQTIRKMERSLLLTDSAKKANAILLTGKGVPEKGLFGSSAVQVLSLSNEEHKQLLFFDVMGLKPVTTGVSGKGKLDKEFQKAYASIPEVSMYTQLGKAKKLRNAYVKSFLRLLSQSEDLRHDHCIRPSYRYLEIITSRTAARDPNLQQIPSHSELGKLIKRLFIAPEGYLYIKVDYRVHEVRGWGLISFDKALAEVFARAKALRDEYRLRPNEDLAKRLVTEADVHIMNASYFFSVAIEFFRNVTNDEEIKAKIKDLRNSVKGVIFGLIYQMSLNSLAATLGRTKKFTENLVSNFHKRFPKGMAWIEKVKRLARKHLYVENPMGFRRHLWGFLYPDQCACANKVHAEMSRRAVNSPIQGMCSQFMAVGARELDTVVHDIYVETQRTVDYKVCNSVHDSLENLFSYRDFLLGLRLVEESLTSGVRRIVVERYGWDFVVDLEVDFELGASLDQTKTWDFSLVQLEDIVHKSLIFQRDELGYKINVPEIMEEIFVEGWVDAPIWMKKQAKNIGWKYQPSKYRQSRRETSKVQ